MKKLMFGMAAALALCGMAIESSNIVGYVNRTEVKGGVWQIMPCQFETTESTEIDLQAYVKGTFKKDVSFYDTGYKTSAPQIQIRDPQTGATSFYYYICDAYNEGGDPEELAGWSDDDGNYVSKLTIDPGAGFWFLSPSDCEVLFSGQVVSADTATLKVYPIWTLIGNAFPNGFSLNAIDWTGINAEKSFYDADWKTAAPQIQVRDLETGATSFYYYLKDAYNEGGDPEELAGWSDDDGNYVTADKVIAPGVGFWFRPTETMDVQFKK